MKLGSTPIPEKEVDQSIQYDIETSKEKEKEKENSNNELAESIQRKLMNIFEKVDLLRTEPCLKLLRDLENYLDFTSDLPIDDVVNFNEIIQKGLSAGLTPLHVALIMLRPLYSHSKDITEKMFDRFMDRLNFNIQSTHSDYQGNTALMELALYQIGIDLTVSSPKKSFLDMVFSKLKLATLDFNAMSNKGTPLSILAKLYNTQTSQQHFLKKCLEQIPLELDFTVAVDEGKTIRDLLEKSNIIDKVDLIILLREIKSLVIERNNDDIDSALKVQLGKAQDLAAKIYRCCEDNYGHDLFMNVCIDFIVIKLFKEKFDESMKFFKERHKQISRQRQERYNSWFEKGAHALFNSTSHESAEKEGEPQEHLEDRQARLLGALDYALKIKSSLGEDLRRTFSHMVNHPTGLPSGGQLTPLCDAISSGKKELIVHEALKLEEENEKLKEQLRSLSK